VFEGSNNLNEEMLPLLTGSNGTGALELGCVGIRTETYKGNSIKIKDRRLLHEGPVPSG